MALNESRLAYEDEYKFMDKALRAENGLRMGYPNEEDAKFFRMRLNYARQLDRRFNRGRYAATHPMHQHSEYDALTFRVRREGDKYWLYAVRKPSKGVMEEITKENQLEPALKYRRF